MGTLPSCHSFDGPLSHRFGLWLISCFLSFPLPTTFIDGTSYTTFSPFPNLGLTREGLLHDGTERLTRKTMSAHYYLDGSGRAPEVSLFNHDWTDWVGLNADTTKIPLEARSYKGMSEADWDAMAVTSSGKYTDLEWTTHPDWYRHDTHWRGFGPTEVDAIPSIGSPWYLDMDTPVAYCAVDGGYSFAEIQRGHVTNDLIFFDRCMDEVTASKQFLDGSPVPPAYNRDRLLPTFHSIIALQKEGAAAKRAAWDRLAFLTWWTKACDDWSKGIDVVMAEQVEVIVSRGRKPRGFLFDLFADWHELNVPFLLSRSIPFYYTFSLEARLDERFCRLNPKILASYAGPDGDEVVIHDVDYEAGLEAAEAATHRYDDFFQRTDPSVLNDHRSYESDSSFFVIDFEGWGRRPVALDRECRFLSACFHFTVLGDAHGSPRVIFWRFRPKVSATQQRKHVLWNQWVDDPISIRELFKGVYAPTPSRRFHEELGDPLLDSPGQQDSVTARRPTLRTDPLPLADRLSIANWTRDSQAGNSRSNDVPSLLARMSQRDASPRRIPVRQVSRLESSESDSRGTSRSRSSQGRQRSQSPQPRRARRPTNSVESFKLSLSDAVARFTWKERPEKVILLADSDEQNNPVFQHAFLCVPDWKSQVRMRYYASCRPEVSSMRQVVHIAVIHRLEFAIAIRVADVGLFVPRVVTGLDRMGIKALYQPGFIEPPFSYTKGTPAVFANTYIAKINDILRRPHARAFIGMGGPYSWIAERFGGPSIINAFLSGPSIQVTRHLLGKSDSHEENPVGLQWDQVSAQEGAFLFGFVPSLDSTSPERYLFPPPHYLRELCDHWNGDWNEVMDKIFTRIAEDIERGKAEPRERSWWSSHLRNYNRLPKPINPPFTDADVEDARRILWQANLPRTWDRMLLKSIVIPEHRVL